MIGIAAAFAVAIPNILSRALNNYQHGLGSAGALFGLGYYLLIGAGLGASSWLDNLGLSTLLFAATAVLVTMKRASGDTRAATGYSGRHSG